MKKYQNNYASKRPQMYDRKSRERKAERIVKLLSCHFGVNNFKSLTVLDIGASTGIIDDFLAHHFKKVVGIDIDEKALRYAKKNFKKENLIFKAGDAMNLPFSNSLFDVLICTHVYEHIQNPRKLFDEIYRVLMPGGICYLAAQNKLWPLEAHYNLPFLSYLPKKLADIYIRTRGRKEYYEHPLTYWQLKKLLQKFRIHEYTDKIFQEPKRFGYELPPFSNLFAGLAKYFAPTLFWLLEK